MPHEHGGPLSRRTFLHGTGAAIAGGLLAGCGGGSPQTLEDVTLTIPVLKEGVQNFFTDAGQAKAPYKVDYPVLPFDLALQAIDTDGADCGYFFSDIPLALWGRTLKSSRVVGVIRVDTPGKMLGLVARPGLAARDASDLAGRRIAYLKSSNYHYYLLTLLDQAGLGWNDIEPIHLTRDAMPAAFSSGQLDFWVTQGLDTIIAQQHFGGRLVAQPAAEAYTGNGVIVANMGVLNDPVRSRALGDHLLRLQKVYAWIAANGSAYTTRTAEIMNIDRRLLAQWHAQRRTPTRVSAIGDDIVAQQRQVIDLFARYGQAKIEEAGSGALWDRRYSAILGT